MGGLAKLFLRSIAFPLYLQKIKMYATLGKNTTTGCGLVISTIWRHYWCFLPQSGPDHLRCGQRNLLPVLNLPFYSSTRADHFYRVLPRCRMQDDFTKNEEVLPWISQKMREISCRLHISWNNKMDGVSGDTRRKHSAYTVDFTMFSRSTAPRGSFNQRFPNASW